jgi:hypothetical protein
MKIRMRAEGEKETDERQPLGLGLVCRTIVDAGLRMAN